MEAIVVTVIITAASSFAFVKYQDYTQKIKNEEAEQALIAVYGAQLDYRRQTGNFYSGDQNDINNDLNVNIPFIPPYGLRFFHTLQAMDQSFCSPSINFVAGAVSLDNSYILAISNQGQIRCVSTALDADGNMTGTCGTSICKNMGY